MSPVMTSLTQNWVKKELQVVHSVPTMVERSKSITIQYLTRAIHFSGQQLNITKSWCLPITFLVWSRKVLICTSRANGDKSIKVTIYRNLRLIHWLLNTGFASFKILILVLMSFLLKLGQKAPNLHILCEKWSNLTQF